MSQAQPELTVVICSINPEKADLTCRNIQDTSGILCEFIVVDNRERKWPIAKAYNYGASLAKSPNLFFAHEDILFEKANWGTPIITKLSDDQTGVIGFIGSQIKSGAYAPWGENSKYCIGHVYYYDKDQKCILHNGMLKNTDFRPVLVVDGLGMFVSRKVWSESPFDEQLLTGFHCYDIDFCLAISLTRTNYVFFGTDICHYSNGNMDEKWLLMTLKLTDTKWSKILPKTIDDGNNADMPRIRAEQDYSFLYKAIRDTKTISISSVKKILKRYLHISKKDKYYRSHLFPILWQYLFKRVF